MLRIGENGDTGSESRPEEFEVDITQIGKGVESEQA